VSCEHVAQKLVGEKLAIGLRELLLMKYIVEITVRRKNVLLSALKVCLGELRFDQQVA
jgi:hypothetical protein